MPPKIKKRVAKKSLICWNKEGKTICAAKSTFSNYKPRKKKKAVKPEVKKAVVKKAVVKKAVVKKAVVKKAVVKKAVVKPVVKPVVKKPDPPKRKLRNKAERDEIFKTFIAYMKSPSKRQMNYVLKMGLDSRDITRVADLKKLVDFYPTPTRCLEQQIIRRSDNILECTAGLGYVVNDVIEINPRAKITAYEYDEDLVRIGNNILGTDILQRKNFLKIPLKNDYDFIFCNPPFSSSYSKKDPYYVKFLIKVIQLRENNTNKGKLQIQFLCPITLFMKIGDQWKGNSTLGAKDFFKKVSQKQLKIYCDDLGYDINKLMTSDLYFKFTEPCQFETTAIKTANFLIEGN
jgi:hypothetical protein